MTNKNKKQNINKKPDYWARSFGIAAILLSGFSIFLQFYNFKHDLTANIRNLDAWTDSIYFEVVLINNGDYDEIIKKGGFVYRSGKIENERSQRSFDFEKIKIEKGEKKIINIEHPNFDKSDVWQLGITENKSCIIEVFFYLITIDNQGRKILCETKIGQFEIQDDLSKWKDETPKLMNLYSPNKTKNISDL